MKLSGSIEQIIFRNNNNGYSVILLDVDGQPVTINGNFPSISEGETVVVEGEYKQTKYGMQLVCSSCEISAPSDASSVIRYLASGLIKGVGEVTADNIVKKFGDKSLYVIEHQPQLLKTVKGISARKAVDIANNYAAIKKMQKAVMFLQGLGLSIGLSMKIYDKYGEGTETAVVKNPYRLIEEIDGIGFKSADNIATKLGIDRQSDFRLRAASLYVVKNFSETTGSTYIPYDILLSQVQQLLEREVTEEDMLGALKSLTIDMLIRVYMRNGEKCVCQSKLFNTEKAIAKKLIELNDGYVNLKIDTDAEIEEYQRINGITLHENQKKAIASAVNGGVVVITGGPGTGKTTIVNCILCILKARGLTVELVAPTGRAAKRLSETTGEDAKTIHRLLDLDFKDGKGFFTYNESTKLDCQAVICDEVSMVDAYLMGSLLSAIKNGSKLILVGDKDQLPSVGAGNVLGDIISSQAVPTVMLTEIYRQDSESLIITNAHRINSGEMPVIKNNNKDFFFSTAEYPEEILQTVVSMVIKRIPSFLNTDSKNIQVLCPMKKGMAGSIAINDCLQEQLNPKSQSKRECMVENMLFREGDKVMQTANNYQMEWKRGLSEIGSGVFNGDIGYVQSINTSSGEMEVLFDDGRLSMYSACDATDLTLAYAMSIHKSQGSEFDIAIIPITGGHKALLTRNLLYTAVTRAKKMVVIVGSRQNLKNMIDNDYTEKRYSLLADFIKMSAENI